MVKLTLGAKKESPDHDSTKVQKPPREELHVPEGGAGGKPFYGIRNYLHQFYQSPSVEDMEGAGGWYLLPPHHHKRKGLVVCRAFTVLGLVLLLIGATAIVVGYTWPKPDWDKAILRLDIHHDDRGPYIKKESFIKIFEDPMRPWKLTGLAVFTVGGIILAVSLLVPTCANCLGGGMMAGFASEFDTPAEPPIRIYPTAPNEQSASGENEPKQPLSPVESKVPVMEAISKVQPDPEPGEGRITGESLQSAEQEAEIPASEN